MDDDVEAVPRAASMEGSYHGHDGIRRFWKNLLNAFPDFTIEVVEVLQPPGDLTLAALRLRSHGASSGVPSDETVWQVARWRREKCVWLRNFDTRDEALEAVGLSEQDVHADA
jgi:SnoaL-like domain